MKILVLTPTFFPVMGGAELGIFEICRRLGLKHEVTVLTPWPPKAWVRDYGMEEPEPGPAHFQTIRFNDWLNFMKLPLARTLRGAVPPFSFSFVEATREAIERSKPDLVNAFYALPTGLAALAAQKRKKIPVVLSLIGRDMPGPGIPPLWASYARFVARSLREKIFISKYSRGVLLGSHSEEGRIVPFGVDLEKFHPATDGRPLRGKLKIPEGSKVLFALQRLDPWKRVDVVVKAMNIVLGKMDAYLVIGGKGAEQAPLMRLVRDRGLSSRVVFTGYIKESDLPFYYAMSDLFIFHSTYETFGLVLLQAMASGKPVVSVRSTAIPELIDHRRTGVLVEPLNPNDLAQAAIALLKDEAAMTSFSAEARKRAVEEYSWQRVADLYEQIFERCRMSS